MNVNHNLILIINQFYLTALQVQIIPFFQTTVI